MARINSAEANRKRSVLLNCIASSSFSDSRNIDKHLDADNLALHSINYHIGDIMKTLTLSVSLFFIVFLVYTISPIRTSFDSRWAVPTALSIIEDQDTDLSEYQYLLDFHSYYCIQEVRGMQVTTFPVWTYMLSVPAIFTFDRVILPVVTSLEPLNERAEAVIAQSFGEPREVTTVHLYSYVEKAVASSYLAVTAIFIFLSSLFFLKKSSGFALALIFTFSTSAWSSASRSLCMHGPSMMFLSITLYLLLREEFKKPRSCEYISLPLTAAFLIRPTNAIPLAIITVYIFVRHRSSFIRYLLWGIPLFAVFLVFNLSEYGSVLPYYFNPTRLGTSLNTFLTALAGNLVSPSRGLFVFSPFLLFGFHGMYLGLKDHRFRLLSQALIVIAVLHLVSVSLFPHWWGGHCYGPRFMSDIIPVVFFFLFLSLEKLLSDRKIFWIALFSALVLFSTVLHFRGAWHFDVYRWSNTPVNIDDNPERLWDWSDPQFMR